MDNRRFFLFLVLSTSVLLAYSVLQSVLAPAPESTAEADPSKGQNGEKDGEQGKTAAEKKNSGDKAGDEKAGGDGATETVDPKTVDPKTGDAEDDPPNGDAPAADNATRSRASIAQQWISLGEFNGTSKLLVTLNNRGGAIERIELVERDENGKLKYRDLDREGGYFGNVVLSPTTRGAVVEHLPPGTPAANSGLKVGDTVIQANGQTVKNESDLRATLRLTRPGDELKLTITKQGQTTPSTISTKLVDTPLQLLAPERDVHGTPVGHPPSFLLSLESLAEGETTITAARDEPRLSADLASLRGERWEVKRIENGVEFHFVYDEAELKPLGLSGGLEVVKRYRLSEVLESTPAASAKAAKATAEQPLDPSPETGNGYHLDFDIELINRGEQDLTYAFRLDGANGLTKEGWWYSNKIHPSWGSAGARDVVWKNVADGHQLRSPSQVWKRARKEKSPTEPLFTASDPGPERSLAYIGIDTQFFNVALLPKVSTDHLEFARATPFLLTPQEEIEKREIRAANVTYRVFSQDSVAPAESAQSHSYRIFAGPKHAEVLAAYDMGDAIEYGWFPMVAKPLGALLHFFYFLTANYGLAIILLTILVRGCMHPISRKAAKNAQMMQELAPEIKKIGEKYKSEPDKKMKAQQDLYRKHNFNPFGGCLLMFFQLPVFIGLYRCLSVDIELRQAALIPGISWCSNLAGPDMLWRWGPNAFPFLTDYTGWLGPYFNVLPIITVVLFLVQQKMFTPPATDEQTMMQQKMMKYMMVFIGVMFYKVASGLCLYFIASSLFGILERKVFLPKRALAENPEGDKPTPASKSSSKKSLTPGANGNGSTSRPAARKQKRKRR